MNWLRGHVATLVLCLAFSPAIAHAVEWDPAVYAKYSAGQYSAAQLVLRHITFRGDESVLDVGSGDGKITAAMSEKVPNGSIVGVDVSPAMVSYAQTRFPKDKYPNLRFEVQDAQTLNFSGQFDLVVSFSALHWAADQDAVLKGIWKALKPGGTFAMSMVRGFYAPLEETTDEMTRTEKWGKYLARYSAGFNFVQRDRYVALLTQNGFQPLAVQDVFVYLLFPDRQQFKEYVAQWYVYRDAVPPELRDEFLNEVLDRYLVKQPVDSQGQILFVIRHLQVAAKRADGEGRK